MTKVLIYQLKKVKFFYFQKIFLTHLRDSRIALVLSSNIRGKRVIWMHFNGIVTSVIKSCMKSRWILKILLHNFLHYLMHIGKIKKLELATHVALSKSHPNKHFIPRIIN